MTAPGFSAGAGWADYDRDGDLDLYVTNYVQFDEEAKSTGAVSLQYGSETPYTLNPSSFAPAANQLFRNEGNGRFVEVGQAAGVSNPSGRSLSVAWLDFDADGWLDLYVANDVSDNGVFKNNGDGTFEDIGAQLTGGGLPRRDGIGRGGHRRRHRPGHLRHALARPKKNALFENMNADDVRDRDGKQRMFFMDAADAVGLGQATLKLVGWATRIRRFRCRRRSRPVVGERPHLAALGGTHPAHCPTNADLSTGGRRFLRGRDAHGDRADWSAAAARTPTSTGTAGWMSPWRCRAARRGYCATSAI